MEGYLKVAGGKEYLKSPLAKALKEERQAFEHGQREGLTKEELYALSKVSHGGVITKSKAKFIAGAALHIAREHEREVGGLAPGLHGGQEREAAKRLMKMEQAAEAPPEPVKTVEPPSAGQRRAALQERLHIQHAPITGRQAVPSISNVIEPIHLPDTPAGWSAPQPAGRGNIHDAAPSTGNRGGVGLTAPSSREEGFGGGQQATPQAPRVNPMVEVLTGGVSADVHPHDDSPAPSVAMPSLRGHETTVPDPSSPTPAETSNNASLPDMSHVDEGLPF